MLDVTRKALEKALANGSRKGELRISDPYELPQEGFENSFSSLWSRAEGMTEIGPWFFSNKECTRFAFLTTNESIVTYVLKQKGE
ncbi:hypothetical protein SEA_RUNHAAR_43 [Gordonia phage Runhaar]|nr:hypothetical protein SEA_RUNHAAR_43 [Gordonia phage Runhaar]